MADKWDLQMSARWIMKHNLIISQIPAMAESGKPYKKSEENAKKQKPVTHILKNVFGFFSFLEMAEDQFGPLQVLSYGTIHVANSVGVKRRLRFRSFAGYLKEEEREVRAAEKNEIVIF